MNTYLDIKEEVKAALAEGKPVVALESTIISHGMPFPQNLEMVHRCESLIRAQGAIPATIALMDGKIKVGLSEEEVMTLAKATDVVKVSRRDFAEVLANQKIGATTVAATMIAAAMAGIRFFATGGIGGVHRGYEQTMDVSADLEELSRNEVTVVCAGAKSILDLPRTLEYLETKGVPVIGYQTDVLPQFFCADSPYRLNSRMDTPQAIAHFLHTKEELQLGGGVLITNPIPKEASLDQQYIEAIIEEAIVQAQHAGIRGKDVTPYLLAAIVEKSEGKSLQANLALVYHNATLAAQIALCYSQCC